MSLIPGVDPAFVASGFAVGALVGLTGVGGGSLMTPLLVLAFGVKVTTAVGTDLLFAALTKSVGVLVHGSSGTVDWLITRRLAIGSLPAAVVTLCVLRAIGIEGNASSAVVTTALGIGLIATAICLLSRRWLLRLTETRAAQRIAQRPAAATIAVGAALGVLVSMSSVGAGAIGMTALVLLYPQVSIARLVGSDLAHAVPLTLLGAVGYWLLGSIDWLLLGSLLLGSVPGIIVGSRLSSRVPDTVLRPIVATTLIAVGIKVLG